MSNEINKKCSNVFEWKQNQLKYPKQKIPKDDGREIHPFHKYPFLSFRHKLQLDINMARQKLQEDQQKHKKAESELRKDKWRCETG